MTTGGHTGLVKLAALAGNIYETNAAFDTPPVATNAPGQTVTGSIFAGTLAAQAGTPGGAALQSVLLYGAVNNVATLTGLGAGLVSGATAAFALTDNASLTIAAGATVETGSSTAGGALSLAANGAPLHRRHPADGRPGRRLARICQRPGHAHPRHHQRRHHGRPRQQGSRRAHSAPVRRAAFAWTAPTSSPPLPV